MTKEEILKKYGEVRLKFSFYYKFTFVFSGESKDGTTIEASIGGDSDSIYQLSIDPDDDENLHTLRPTSIEVSKDGKSIATWYDY